MKTLCIGISGPLKLKQTNGRHEAQADQWKERVGISNDFIGRTQSFQSKGETKNPPPLIEKIKKNFDFPTIHMTIFRTFMSLKRALMPTE